MNEPQPVQKEYRVNNPVEAFERLKAGVKQALTVSKPEIVRREAEWKEQRQAAKQSRNQNQ